MSTRPADRDRRGSMPQTRGKASDIAGLAMFFGVVAFIVFLAWGAGPNSMRTAAHTPLTRAQTTGMGGLSSAAARADDGE